MAIPQPIATPDPPATELPETQAAPSAKAAQIMAAAGRLFLDAGYGATSMDAVARTAGVSKATLYAHFTNKADLFSAIVAAACARAVPAVVGPEIDHLPVAEALIRLGRNFLDLLLTPEARAVFRVVVAEAPRFPELGRAFYHAGPEQTLSVLARYLERADHRGLLWVPEPFAAAELLAGMIRSHAHLRCLLGVDPPPEAPERDRHVRRVVALFLHGCQGPAAETGAAAPTP